MGSYVERIRERPRLDLNIDVQTPTGGHSRLGWDDPNPVNAPMNLSFSTVLPGGFERCSFTLERDSRVFYPDTAELSTVTVMGPGGETAWQGRLEKIPDTGGYQQQEQPEAVGFQAELEDDNSAREIYVDRDMAKWVPAETQRKIALLGEGFGADNGPNVAPAPDGTIQAIETGFSGVWEATTRPVAEAWYFSSGIPIGYLYAGWQKAPTMTVPGAWVWDAYIGGVGTGNLVGAGPGVVNYLAGNATYALLQLYYTAGGGADGALYAIWWSNPAVYGRHGLPSYGTDPRGFLASDVVAHAVGKWTKLAYTTGPEGTIQPSSFVIAQLAFLEPTTVAEILKQATRFELQDWAVWEGPTFFMKPRDSGWRGEPPKEWRARVGPAQLQEAGPQVSRLWNGVIVVYTDVTGISRTVGPPGSGAEATSTQLIDSDPENPLNEIGRKRYAKLSMGTSTVAGAEQVGAIFLRESKTLETSGQASLVGHVESSSGVLYPAWAVRAGDVVSFVDAADASPRRIVHGEFDDSTKACGVALDQPPDSMTAILERLSASLIGTGLS